MDAFRLVLLPRAYQLGFTDAFEAIVVFFAAATCIRAARQSSGISRALWAAIGVFFALNLAADVHDFLADSPLGISHAIPALEFLGWCTYFPLALILFFPISEDARLKWKWIPIIDFVQVAIAAALACFELVYLYHRNLNKPWTQFGSPEAVRNALICTGLLLRALVDPSRHARMIYNVVGVALTGIMLGEATRPAGGNLLQQQAKFDVFLEEFNQERPHEALAMKCPAEVYSASCRIYRGIPEVHYPFHDRTVMVTSCGRLCLHNKKINLCVSLAGQAVGVKEVDHGIWLVSFMDYDLGSIDLEEKTLQPLENPFGPKV